MYTCLHISFKYLHISFMEWHIVFTFMTGYMSSIVIHLYQFSLGGNLSNLDWDYSHVRLHERHSFTFITGYVRDSFIILRLGLD